MAYTQLKNALGSVLSAAVLLVAGGLPGLGSTLPVLAQESSEVGLPFLHNYSTEEYDASYQNWAIVQDKRGVMYFGNNTGVLEYDGVSWRRIQTANHSVVRSLAIDEAGVIYAGGRSEFGYLAPDALGQLHYVSLLDQVPEAERDFIDVWNIRITSTSAYFLTNKYLFRWSGQQMKTWTPDDIFVPSASYVYRDTLFIVDDGTGLMRMDGDVLEPVHAQGEEQLRGLVIEAMLPYGGDRILIGTSRNGLYLYDGSSVTPFPNEADAFLRENRLYSATVLRAGLFALGTDFGGTVILDQQGRQRALFNKVRGLQNETILEVYEDRQRGLWLALNDGITRVEAASPFSHFEETHGVADVINALVRHQGTLYVGMFPGLYRMEPASGALEWRFVPVPEVVTDTRTLLSLGRTLLVANEEGVYAITDGAPALIQRDWAESLHRSRQDTNVVFVGQDGSLAQLRYDAEAAAWVDAGKVITDLTGDVFEMAEDSDGALWLGLYAGWVVRVGFPEGLDAPPEVTYFDEGQGLPVGNKQVFDLAGRAMVWTDEGGLFAYEAGQFVPKTLWPHAVAETEGLYLAQGDRNGTAWTISRDDLGSILRWGAASDAGDPFHQVRLPRGALFAEESSLFAEETPSGLTVWIGTKEGILRFVMNEDVQPSVDYPALIRRVTAGDSLLFGGTAFTGYAAPRLRHEVNPLRFEYAAPSFGTESGTQYQTWLEGLAKEWSLWTAETAKEYTNLREGRYTFRVRARNVDGHASMEGHFAFVVLPPWYRTWWAYGLWALFGLSLVYGGVRWRTTRLKRRTQELERIVEERTEELRRANETKSRFLANISHEFRTPLTLTFGPLQDFLDRRIQSYDEAQPHFERALRNGRRLLQLINQLLDLSRIESGTLTLQARRQDLNDFISQVSAQFESLADSRAITLHVGAPPGPFLHGFDADMLENALVNLLANAFKFTPDGGTITLHLHREADGKACIEVGDTGVGIAADHVPYLFDRFYQVDATTTRKREGVGIGLALVKELVALHGGTITVESKVGVGTRFMIHLPDVPLEAAGLDEEQAPARRTTAAQLTVAEIETSLVAAEAPQASKAVSADATIVLLVEDNADMRAYLRDHLKDHFEVVEAENGKVGLARARELVPDLVLSDVMMPEMDGLDLCKALKHDERTSHIPVVLLTAKADVESRISGFERGADAYLPKPFNAEELQVRVRSLIDQRRALRKKFSRAGGAITITELALPSQEVAFLEQVQHVVEARLSDASFGVNALAEEMGMSQRQLLRKLRALTGETSHELIWRLRLEQAAQLLRQNVASVKEVAFAVGFKYEASFSRSFRKVYDVSPSEYAEQEDQQQAPPVRPG